MNTSKWISSVAVFLFKFAILSFSVLFTNAHAETVWFVAANALPANQITPPYRDDSFVIPMNNPDDIAKARDIIQYGSSEQLTLMFTAVTGADGVNKDYRTQNEPLWSWHVGHFKGWTSGLFIALPMPVSATAIEQENWHSQTGNLIYMPYKIVQELTIIQFSHSQLTDNCDTCHNGTDQTGIPLTHIATTNVCQSCHTTELFKPAVVDHSQLDLNTAACIDCHAPVCITSVCEQHIDSTDNCDACHNFDSWVFIHADTTGDCISCHNNSPLIGKSVNHPVTDNACEVCHYNSTFKPFANVENPAVLLKDISPGGISGLFPPFLPIVMGQHIYFWANDGVHGTELWRTDGTAEGTLLFIDIRPGPASAYPPDVVAAITSLNDKVFFSANDQRGTELWVSDGTLDNTRITRDIALGPLSSKPYRYAKVGDQVYFTTDQQYPLRPSLFTTKELWKTDGTGSGTALVKDFGLLDSGFLSSISFNMFAFNNEIYFNYSNSIWKSDGTNGGTIPVSSLSAELPDAKKIIAVTPQLLFFTGATDAWNTTSLWGTDGSAGGTVKIADSVRLPYFGTHYNDVTNKLYFINKKSTANELWETDGTANSTRLIKNIPNETNISSIDTINQFGSKIIFSNKTALWVSDGSTEGTLQLLPDNTTPKIDNSFRWAGPKATVGNIFYFVYSDQSSGSELWRTNGTQAGTYMVKDIKKGATGSMPAQFHSIKDVLYFTADDGIWGRELWRSDGTEAGTVLVQDFEPGPGSSDVWWHGQIGDFQLLRVDTTLFGNELWTIDVTALDSGSMPTPQ